MTTSDEAPVDEGVDVEPAGARPGAGVATAPARSADEAGDPDVDHLARAIDPPGRGERMRALPGNVVHRLAGWPVESWISLLLVGACVVFVAIQLGPDNILANTTPAGGDMGAHVWGPAFMRDHLLPSFRLVGWSPDWYAGFPAYQFYMVLPSLAIALLSFVIPYGIAFKLVAVSGLLMLPISAWAFGRLTRLPFPGPPLLAIGATAFLFDRSFSILGGNIASTMAGEFAFSISLSFALLFLGVVGRGMENGKHRAAAAALLAITGMCHLIPFLFAITGAAVWFVVSLVRRPGARRRLWWVASAGAVGVALTGWWLIPFYLRSPYMNDMGWEKRTTYIDLLFRRENLDSGLVDQPRIEWILVLALLGIVMSIAWKRRIGGYLVVLATTVALAFWLVPQGRLWNSRLLPFWYLCLYLLAAVGVAELGRTIATLVARDPARPSRWVTVGTGVVAWLVVFTALAMPLRSMPGGSLQADGSYRWLFLSTRDSSFVTSWARWNFTGYENKPAYPEYYGIITTMGDLGRTQGCGRAMWEHEEQHDRYGTPMALMLLPFWTDGCIGSMEGLFFESSGTTPYHFLNQDELSTGPSNAQRDLPYQPGPPTDAEFDLGIEHLQMLGVKYYMAISEPMIAKGRANPSLKEVATSGPWVVFEVADSELVTPLDNQPAVLTGTNGAHGWLEATLPWYEDPTKWSVPLASGGPSDWQRIEPGQQPQAIPTDPVAVSDVQQGTDTVSFKVSKTGTPVVVKTSYFPNWKVDGADGPWRISPNLMVVVPTSNTVTLHYGTTAVDWFGDLVSVLGLVGFVLLVRARPVDLPEPRPWFRRRRPAAAGAGGEGEPGDEGGPDGGPGPGGPPGEGGPPSAPTADHGPRAEPATPHPPGGVPAGEFDPMAVIVGPAEVGEPERPAVPSGSGPSAAAPGTSGPSADRTP